MDKPLWGLKVLKFDGAIARRKTIQPPCGRGDRPLWWLAPPPFPLFEGAQQPVLTVEMLMKRVFRGVLFCPLNRGGKGTRFVREQSDLRIV